MKTLLTKLKNSVLNLKDSNLILVILLSISLVYTSALQRINNNLNDEVAIKTNNIEAYEGMLNNVNAKNTVLRLDVSTLRSSNDTLLQKVDSVRKELKIASKNVYTAVVQQSAITIAEKDTVLINDSCEFTKVFKPNDLTMLKVEYLNDSLSYKLRITNDQFIYVYGDKGWKNKHKRFFKRLVTWDWKKIVYYKYAIINTNPLIEVGTTRVIENIEK